VEISRPGPNTRRQRTLFRLRGRVSELSLRTGPTILSIKTEKQAGRPAVRDLVDRSVKGDPEAFGSLYDIFHTDIYRYFYYHLGHRHDAEDLAARTFLRAWTPIGAFKWKGRPFESWLFTIARNLLLDHHRSTPLTAALPDWVEDSDRGPEGFAIAGAEAAAAREALTKLTDDQRQFVILKYFLDRDNREIAAIMGKREGTLRALQIRALQALRRHLRGD
jgi:RNA polymerase sigma-70 factor (ECF subfamily)